MIQLIISTKKRSTAVTCLRKKLRKSFSRKLKGCRSYQTISVKTLSRSRARRSHNCFFLMFLKVLIKLAKFIMRSDKRFGTMKGNRGGTRKKNIIGAKVRKYCTVRQRWRTLMNWHWLLLTYWPKQLAKTSNDLYNKNIISYPPS